MAKHSKPYSVEVQKGPIRMDQQYANQLRREPEFSRSDIEHNRMRQEKMTLTVHTPKQ